jgi:hypothetical protein
MGYTANQTATQLAAALVSAGMAADAANNATWSLAWAPTNTTVCPLVGFLAKVTTSCAAGAAPVFSYDATPS